MTGVLPVVLDDIGFRPGGRLVLDGLSARIVTSGITALIGPNGAGKSVTLRLIDGLLTPDRGAIRFHDRAPESVRRAFVFQRPALVRASVAANVALGLASERASSTKVRERVRAALDRVGLTDRAGDPAR